MQAPLRDLRLGSHPAYLPGSLELPQTNPQFWSTEHVCSRDHNRNQYWGEPDCDEEAKLVESILEAIEKQTGRPGPKCLTLGKLL